MKATRFPAVFVCLALCLCLLAGCASGGKTNARYLCEEVPLERNGIALHLDCVTLEDMAPKKDILLTHGVTYSSHEFDIDYADYSLVRYLARAGYAVWRLDIAGFGRSGEVADGFLPDSDYAAEDICAAVEAIAAHTGRETLYLLGWSWGTVTASRYVAQHPERVDRLVLYAPILSGLGEAKITEAFHHNTWEHAADDFQRRADGSFDPDITDPTVLELFCSSCWHYDGDESPNGGRRDLCVSETQELIDLASIRVPTLILCGDSDPYLNYALVNAALGKLPEGSRLELIPGGAHAVMLEKPYYRDFQKRLSAFLK